MFDAIAKRYDMVNKVISLGSDVAWRRALVDALDITSEDNVLDLATGTADVAIMISRDASSRGANVTGLDPSANMLEIGREKVAAADLSKTVTLIQGDAQAIEYPSNTFDKVCISFGIRNIPDRLSALREMMRVAKPGARVAVLEFSDPPEGPLAPFARFFLTYILPRLGALFSGGASEEYMHLQRSIAAFPLPEEFTLNMKSVGLEIESWRCLHPGGVYLYVAQTPTES